VKRKNLITVMILPGALTFAGASASAATGAVLQYDKEQASLNCRTQADIPNDVRDFGTVLRAHGIATQIDPLILASTLADRARVSWGADNLAGHVDGAEFSLIATHGGVFPAYSDSWDGNSSGYVVDRAAFWLGHEAGNGNTEAGGCMTYGRDMRIGDRAQFVYAVSCQSFQYEASVANQMPAFARTLHQYGGFHGSVSMTAVRHVKEFTEAAMIGSAPLACMDEMRLSSTTCPVVAIQGNDLFDAIDRAENEKFASPNPYPAPDSTPYTLYYYYSRCNPPHGSILPN